MRFEWDEDKARSNLAKHGVSFDRARTVFDDPNVITEPDRFVDGQWRWRSIGRIGFVTVVFVAHTWEEPDGQVVVRIISARKADSYERRAYEGGDEGNFR